MAEDSIVAAEVPFSKTADVESDFVDEAFEVVFLEGDAVAAIAGE